MPQNDNRPSARSLAAACGEWLTAYDWDHWVTLTFAPPRLPQLRGGVRPGPGRPRPPRPGPPPDYAHRQFRYWVRRLGVLGGAPVWWFRGDELGERLGRLHLHALLGGTGRLATQSLGREWRAGFSLVKPYDPALGAAHYLTKYATKGLADYDVSGRWGCDGLLPPLPSGLLEPLLAAGQPIVGGWDHGKGREFAAVSRDPREAEWVEWRLPRREGSGWWYARCP